MAKYWRSSSGYFYKFSEFIDKSVDFTTSKDVNAYNDGGGGWICEYSRSGDSGYSFYAKHKLNLGWEGTDIQVAESSSKYPYYRYRVVMANSTWKVASIDRMRYYDLGEYDEVVNSFGPAYIPRPDYNTTNQKFTFIYFGEEYRSVRFVWSNYTHVYKVSYSGESGKYFLARGAEYSNAIEDILSQNHSGVNVEYIGEYYCVSNGIDLGDTFFKGKIYNSLPDITSMHIEPYGAYMALNSTTQFKLVIEIDKENFDAESISLSIKWSVSGFNEGDEVSTTWNGLVTLGDNVTCASFMVKAYIETFDVSTDTTVYVSGNQPPPWTPDPGPYGPGGNSSPGGGNGNFGRDEVSDDLLPELPEGTTEANDSYTGMYTRYLVNASAMYPFSEWLWTDDLGLNVAKTIISLMYGSPADALISLVSYPFSLDTLVPLESRSVVWGNYQSPITWSTLSKNSIQVDWGEVEIKEYWGNFLDYDPHTKIELYLPWGAGFVELDVGQVMNSTIKVISNIELAKGTCLHTVFNGSGSALGSYSASVGKSLPLIASDYASKQVAMAGTAIGIAAGAVASGGAALSAGANAAPTITYHKATLGTNYANVTHYANVHSNASSAAKHELARTLPNAVKPAIASATAMAMTPAKMIRSGSFQEGSAGLGLQFPYIILSRPTQSMPDQYGHFYGYPSNMYLPLYSLVGYTEIGEIHLDGLSATESEIKELDGILKGGVIF